MMRIGDAIRDYVVAYEQSPTTARQIVAEHRKRLQAATNALFNLR